LSVCPDLIEKLSRIQTYLETADVLLSGANRERKGMRQLPWTP